MTTSTLYRISSSVISLCLLLFCSTQAGFAEDAPPLPPGLGGGASDAGPALPAGLGDSASSTTPSLPPGLGGGETNGPALPPGLGAESADSAKEAQTAGPQTLFERLRLHGFWEARGGVRTQEDAAQPADAIIGETRLQLKSRYDFEAHANARIEATADLYLDGVLEDPEADLRMLRLTWPVSDTVDVRIGRQVLTWGTGDMLFINDLFPKDWPSFFMGRDAEYLKAPSDTVRIGWYPGPVNIEFVYTPQFTPDRFITGERISYWNPLLGRHGGQHEQVDYNAPSTWFEDDEFALRIYKNIGGYEFAVYGYSGYWKSPGGQRLIPLMQASFPKLNVYGASVRGTVGRGIGNIEVGYYDSRQDRPGGNPLINNSEFRLLAGYEQELAKEFTGAFQYYLEHMMDYGEYERARFFFEPKRHQNRQVLTVRLTKLLMNQNLTLSLFMYYSPTDGDAYLRPLTQYKMNDHWTFELGGNVFVGRLDTSFFGQFEDNTNVYASARYSF